MRYPGGGGSVADWRQQLADLQQRRPDLAERVCRRILVDLQRRGLVDFDTLDDQAVTIRDRDTMAQDRVSIDQVKGYLAERL